jgi:hypothetical protein
MCGCCGSQQAVIAAARGEGIGLLWKSISILDL